jgi:hypothetical protein
VGKETKQDKSVAQTANQLSKIIKPSSSAISKSSPTFLAIKLDFLASKPLAFN